MKVWLSVLTVLWVGVAVAVAYAFVRQPEQAPSYYKDQARAGLHAYSQYGASCHGPN